MNNLRIKQRYWLITMLSGLLLCTPAQAKKPPKPPGGEGGGGSPAFTLVDLGEHQSVAVAVTEPDGDGNVLVSGMTWLGGPQPIFWSVGADGFFVPMYPGLPAGASQASITDMNDAGVITLATQGADGGWLLAPGGTYEQVPFPGSYADALTINNLGVIGGEADFTTVGGGWEGALWILDEQGDFLDPIPLGDFRPRDITDFGLMAGSAYNAAADRAEAALAWFDEHGDLQVEFLSVLPGAIGSEAVAVSSNGEWVVGASHGQAFVWSDGTGILPLGTLGGYDSTALDVNASGQVVGYSATKGAFSQAAFLWQGGVMSDLNELAESGHKPHLQWATAINDAGHIIGITRTSRNDSDEHGYVLIPNTP